MEQRARLRSLDGLRALAALAVLCFHYRENVAYYGLMGAELFFVISGFVILMTLERSNSLADFAVGRAGRLYPAYWISVAVAGLFLWFTNQVSVGSVLLNATMLQGFFDRPNIIDPYWTLKYELLFYGVMAAIFWARRLSNIDSFALIWLCCMILLRGSMLLGGKGGGLYYIWYVQLLLMPQFGHLFIAGMMLYRISTGRRTLPTYIALGLAIVYSLFGRPDWAHIDPIPYFLINAVFIAAVWAASLDRAPVLITNRALVGIGVCSYSLYLLHLPVLLLFQHFFPYLSNDLWFMILVIFPASIGAAVITRVFIERPAQIWVKRKWAASKKPGTLEASPRVEMGIAEPPCTSVL